MSGTTESPHSEQSLSAQISNLVVGLLHTYTGRGPTKAWTSIDDDLVTVVLRDTLSKGERSLVSDDRKELVLEMRQAYQQTMGPELVAGVERLTGRNVLAFMSANHLEPDIAVESFVLEPRAARAKDDDSA
ncbi:MAG: Na-translocating system protein MpsC family protein [Solirubrobacteraceae bacterium]